MRINLHKTSISFLLILLITFFIISCNENKKQIDKRIKTHDRIFSKNDTVYKKSWFAINYRNNKKEEIEIYTFKNDTISNQFIPLRNNQVDLSKAEFYELEITNSEKQNFYKGKITIHSKYDKLQLNKFNKKTLEFNFCEQNLDSMWITTKTINSSNTLEFEFQNSFGNRLQGLVYLKVERDTILEKEPSINLYRLQMLVDNNRMTSNLFLKAYEFDKENKFNTQKLKLNKK